MSVKRVVRGGPGREHTYGEFIMDDASDKSSLPISTSDDPATASSQAFTKDLEHTYLLGHDDVWREV